MPSPPERALENHCRDTAPALAGMEQRLNAYHGEPWESLCRQIVALTGTTALRPQQSQLQRHTGCWSTDGVFA